MGSCMCKNSTDDGPGVNDAYGVGDDAFGRARLGAEAQPRASYSGGLVRKSLSATVDTLVNETLEVIGTITDSDPEPPSSILTLHAITDKPTGWIEMVKSLMRVVPVEHPMGPSVIALLLDDSPLPTRESVSKVADMINSNLKRSPRKERNLCVILGCLAEKLAGPSSVALLNENTLKYLIANLSDNVEPNVKLLSLIALEKCAQTSENKTAIKKILTEIDKNPLPDLEKHYNSKDYLQRQIGFCARWCLDNYFIVDQRSYAYESTDVTYINAMLNTNDVSEYLKISPDGLEARCDAYTFESVRCTFQITSGCWYYEVLLVTPGVMQIGWATKESSFLSDDGYGIGDDKFSIGFDGCRKLIWHNAKSIGHNLSTWKSGSVLGCLIDIEKHEVIFSLDGRQTEPYKQVFHTPNQGFFAAGSFMSFQQCRFNFGLEPFRYPPNRHFRNFNDFGNLTKDDKIVLPRHIYLDLMRKVSVEEDSCTICFDQKAIVRLEPCRHRGFCETCADQISHCPMCRSDIKGKLVEQTDIVKSEELTEAITTSTNEAACNNNPGDPIEKKYPA
ncbi:RING finger and SPRY domain-containing protein 1-like [Teleopsis dalmanni]|uniref:RING finger and SPRY domain-containing protein 1-like n=1 Tax=Teleopsis dalmanni TaxID=139649 RepID=UPI0018CCD4A2|nr:RING finger and SPRY domain-containing protein 1-like [Teleopsis dalmanni]